MTSATLKHRKQVDSDYSGSKPGLLGNGLPRGRLGLWGFWSGKATDARQQDELRHADCPRGSSNQTNEAGERISPFERGTLIERHCQHLTEITIVCTQYYAFQR